MSFLRETVTTGKIEMREQYARTMLELARKDPRIVILDDDCMHSMNTIAFAEALPAQHINCGIQEQNLIGLAAGMSAEGLIPFVNGFGVFVSRRAFDQVYLSCGYARLNVKLVGWDSGVSAAVNGGTHMPLEDAGIMRCIPEMTVMEPADTASFAAVLKLAAAHNGNVYIRSLRKAVPEVYMEGVPLEIGKACVLREGSDVSILTAGLMVSESLRAAETLAGQGILARVVDVFTLKPLDRQCVLECAKKTGAIVTAENHNIIGGLYSAVSEACAASFPVPIEAVAVEDLFGEVGSQDWLQKRFGLTAGHIVEQAIKVIARKNA